MLGCRRPASQQNVKLDLHANASRFTPYAILRSAQSAQSAVRNFAFGCRMKCKELEPRMTRILRTRHVTRWNSSFHRAISTLRYHPFHHDVPKFIQCRVEIGWYDDCGVVF